VGGQQGQAANERFAQAVARRIQFQPIRASLWPAKPVRINLPPFAGGDDRDAWQTSTTVATAMTKQRRCKTSAGAAWRTPIETRSTCHLKNLLRS